MVQVVLCFDKRLRAPLLCWNCGFVCSHSEANFWAASIECNLVEIELKSIINLDLISELVSCENPMFSEKINNMAISLPILLNCNPFY